MAQKKNYILRFYQLTSNLFNTRQLKERTTLCNKQIVSLTGKFKAHDTGAEIDGRTVVRLN